MVSWDPVISGPRRGAGELRPLIDSPAEVLSFLSLLPPVALSFTLFSYIIHSVISFMKFFK
jgi:hypothetical protein